MTTQAGNNPLVPGTPANTGGLTPDPLVGKPTGKEEALANWAGPYVTSMLGKSAAYAESPYEVYGGPLTAGTSELQQKYFSGLGGLNFPGALGKSFTSDTAPTLPTMSATGMPGAAAQPTGIAAQYMNPYLNAVLQPQLNELNRQAQIKQMENAARMSKAGSFGGGRQAILDAELQRNLLTKANEAIGTGYANAYDKAMGQFNTEVGQAKTLADMMASAGDKQRAIEQEGITADLNEFLAQRDDPVNKLKFMQSMLQGLPIFSVSQQYQQPSGMSQLYGQANDVLAFLKALGVGVDSAPKP
jgi:hypothetical protein